MSNIKRSWRVPNRELIGKTIEWVEAGEDSEDNYILKINFTDKSKLEVRISGSHSYGDSHVLPPIDLSESYKLITND